MGVLQRLYRLKGDVMKSKHTSDCACRCAAMKCDCYLGEDRKIKRRAKNALKRQRQKIAIRLGIDYSETLVEVKRAV